MPTYDYLCEACEHAFELFQSMSAPVKRTCPECGKKKLKRLVGTGAGVIFKGGGFYETDYRSDSYKKAAEKDSGAAKASKESKSDSSGGGSKDSGSGSGSGSGDAKKPGKSGDAKSSSSGDSGGKPSKGGPD